MVAPPRLIVVGGGTMATAILEGAGAAGVLAREDVWVAEPRSERHEALAGVAARAFASGAEALAAEADLPGETQRAQVLLAVKPQMLDAAAGSLRSAGESAMAGRVVISILAGVTRARLAGVFGPDIRAVRVMPNTPARIRRGISAIAGAADLEENDLRLARAVFGAVGEVVEIDERLMNAFTALAGSGPAYLFRLAEAMAAAGEAMGFDRQTSARISRATVCGAAALLDESDQTPAELREAVTSKGGTTQAALEALDAGGFDGLVRRAAEAARDRGEQLSG